MYLNFAFLLGLGSRLDCGWGLHSAVHYKRLSLDPNALDQCINVNRRQTYHMFIFLGG